jgi:hypothetical protein
MFVISSCPLVTEHSSMYVQDAEIRSSNSGRVGTLHISGGDP